MKSTIDTPKHSDLVFDVGLHQGEDTDFYLRKGFRVVAFEANPDLAERCRHRFRKYVENGRLTIVEGAIVDLDELSDGQGTVKFFVNRTHAFLGTVQSKWADRNLDAYGTESHTIEVPVVDFTAVLREFGIPYYLKVDIEGCDMVCIRALSAFAERPDYISLESDKLAYANVRSELEQLSLLGYEAFVAVEQNSISDTQSPPFPAREGDYVDMRFESGASGLFGRELGGPWLSQKEVLHQYRRIFLSYFFAGDTGIVWRWQFPGSHRLRNAILGIIRRSFGGKVPMWYDTHARHRSALP